MEQQVDIISAKEARDRTKNKRDDKHSKEMYNIMGMILSAINNCDNNIIVDMLTSYNNDRLKALGYEIKHRQCGLMETEVVISW